MKNVSKFSFAAVALASVPLVLIAQQAPAPAAQQSPAVSAPAPAVAMQTNVATQANAESAPSTTASASAPIEMSPVNGELVGKLDSKSAKAGDSVVVKTVQAMKTSDGTEIPKGSKLMGHVTAVKAHSASAQNSEMAIDFDHAELKGGKNLAIQSVIKSIAPAANDMASSGADAMGAPMGSGMSGGMGGAHAGTPAVGGTQSPNNQVGATSTESMAGNMAAGNTPAAGKVVGKVGEVPIRTTAIPNVFLASNESGAASGATPASSGTLFGAQSDIHLEGGTQMVLEVSPAIVR